MSNKHGLTVTTKQLIAGLRRPTGKGAASLSTRFKLTAADEIERLLAIIEQMSTDPEGDYYRGLHCGVEDRDIHDRYEAVDYGWQQAFEYAASIACSASEKRDAEGGAG